MIREGLSERVVFEQRCELVRELASTYLVGEKSTGEESNSKGLSEFEI